MEVSRAVFMTQRVVVCCIGKFLTARRLILDCIEADFCNQMLILQHFARCKRFTDQKIFFFSFLPFFLFLFFLFLSFFSRSSDPAGWVLPGVGDTPQRPPEVSFLEKRAEARKTKQKLIFEQIRRVISPFLFVTFLPSLRTKTVY